MDDYDHDPFAFAFVVAENFWVRKVKQPTSIVSILIMLLYTLASASAEKRTISLPMRTWPNMIQVGHDPRTENR